MKDLPTCSALITEACFPTDLDKPSDYQAMVYIFFAIYLLFSSMMFLNMLTGVFAVIFREIQAGHYHYSNT